MYLIVGLGNPEPEYCKTRHNMGFDVINKFAEKYNININKSVFSSFYQNAVIDGKKVMIVKPQTYMNSSGEAVKQFVDFYKIPIQNVLVIYDDMDTDIEKIRVRSKGGPGSHNGMKSIISELKDENFPRIRVGIGRPKDEFDRINYVIGHVEDDEYKSLEKGIDKAVEAISCFLINGIDNTMNKYN